MSHPLFILDAGLNASLQQQLRQQIAKAILDLHIPLDSPLPSSRKLAKQLNVARNTVVLAYEHLLDDGYLIARERSCYFVNPEILDHSVQLESVSDERHTSGTKPDWQGRFKLHPTQQENITKTTLNHISKYTQRVTLLASDKSEPKDTCIKRRRKTAMNVKTCNRCAQRISEVRKP